MQGRHSVAVSKIEDPDNADDSKISFLKFAKRTMVSALTRGDSIVCVTRSLVLIDYCCCCPRDGWKMEQPRLV